MRIRKRSLVEFLDSDIIAKNCSHRNCSVYVEKKYMIIILKIYDDKLQIFMIIKLTFVLVFLRKTHFREPSSMLARQ